MDLWVVLLIVLSPAVGSFLDVAVTRTVAGRDFVMGRSTCDYCERALDARDVIPVVSFAILGGQSRCCGRAIPRRTLASELIALALTVSAVTLVEPALLAPSLLLGWMLIALSLFDLASMRLPDVLTLPLLLAGLCAALLGLLGNLGDHALGAALGFAVMWTIRAGFFLWRGIEGMGLGDAKLLAAGGAWLGFQSIPSILLIACFSGLAAAAILHLGGQRLGRHSALPFGPPLALGIWTVWCLGPLVLAR